MRTACQHCLGVCATSRNVSRAATARFAGTQLHIAANPVDPRNRRVSILVRSQVAAKSEQIANSLNETPEEAPKAH